ncbi:archaemetzincin [Dawidia soli]|uniref:Archaemetzincin n=1 Tax=Dawidia soli TaxID=2782352 RepID=A0AAP2GBW3_9BACT|nr:archaemetzincin [Dawidia soli]MBT1685567.1 archaemetzincin [Dawidia soli]
MRFICLRLLLLIIFFVFGCSPGDQLEQNLALIRYLEPLDVVLEKPRSGEWLFEHPEPGQTFEAYRQSKPVSPDGTRRYIYLQPIGALTPIQEEVLRYTAEYLQIFFGLKTIIAEPISDSVIPARARRDRETGEQLLTSYILYDILEKNIPSDAIVVMAVTAKDLYPSDSWNFVFGQASTKKRVGVSSIYRFTDTVMDSMTYPVCLERLIKTSSHEIGHMFSCQHCTHAICVMNGSNSLSESDGRPNRLCSECHMKLCWNLGFDVPERLLALDQFFRRHKLSQDHRAVSKDCARIKQKTQ